MKHMSVFLDVFILLDTVSIILRGGLDDSKKVEHPVSKAIMEHYRSPVGGRHELEFGQLPDTATN